MIDEHRIGSQFLEYGALTRNRLADETPAPWNELVRSSLFDKTVRATFALEIAQ